MSALRLMKSVLLHPIDFFNDIQEEGQSKVWHACMLIFAVILIRIMSLELKGFLFKDQANYEISFLVEIQIIIVLWLTWVIANWGVSTIQGGEGKFKVILVSSAYALTPYIVLTLPLTALSNLFTMKEQVMFIVLSAFVYIWIGFLLLMKTKILHDFELKKLSLITLLTIIGMFIIWFILFLMYGLVSQLISFVVDIFIELKFRL